MAESINLKKRLIGKEDINFDIAGTGETEKFFTSDGGQKVLTKINASHFPLTRSSREKLNATNVDEALNLISDKVDNFEANDALTEDVTVSFLPEDDIETIQNKINQQKKNLNGHTISFLFPVSLAQNLYSTLIWKDFFNGTVIIAGGTDGGRIAIYDKQDINALFKIYRCLCEVRIEYFYFVHQYSDYAISAESSPAVIVKGCQFSGMKNKDSYAVEKITGTAFLLDCELSDDIEFYPPEKGGIGKSIGEYFAYPGSVPPEGAYLLTGQTIANCSELYPQFWEWVQSAGVRIISNDTYEAELASAGVCGGFVVNSANGSVRLPSVTQGTLWGADSTNIGQSLAAGLPNITGNLNNYVAKGATSTGAFKATSPSTSTFVYDIGANGYYCNASLDASRSNSIYGNSNTVQPPAIRVSWCIQVYNAATALSEQESAQLASQMQTKAQTDLGNVTKASLSVIDTIMPNSVDYVVESWTGGAGGWYRKYRSGWIEQGGLVAAGGETTVTLPTAFATTTYNVRVQPKKDMGFIYQMAAENLTKTSFKIYSVDGAANCQKWWYACGY